MVIRCSRGANSVEEKIPGDGDKKGRRARGSRIGTVLDETVITVEGIGRRLDSKDKKQKRVRDFFDFILAQTKEDKRRKLFGKRASYSAGR